MVIYFPLLVALIGLVIYALATNPKPAEVGRIMFFVGMLAFLLTSTPHFATLLK